MELSVGKGNYRITAYSKINDNAVCDCKFLPSAC